MPPFWQRPWPRAGRLAVLGDAGRVRLALGALSAGQLALTRTIEERTRELSDKNRALERDRERESLLEQLAYQASHDA